MGNQDEISLLKCELLHINHMIGLLSAKIDSDNLDEKHLRIFSVILERKKAFRDELEKELQTLIKS